MDETLYALLKDQPFWSWLPREGGRYFDACFHMDCEEIPAGGHCRSQERVGYFVSGRAQLRGQRGIRRAGAGTFFGALYPGKAEENECELWAVTDCTVLWLDADVLTSVCYAACWFHARLIREVEAWRKNQSGD